jgi:hypothetical protein
VKILAAKQAPEKAARARAEAEASVQPREVEGNDPPKEGGGAPQPSVDAKAQRNFTDPESRIMPDRTDKGACLQGYNYQIAVEGSHQIFVGDEVMATAPDQDHLASMMDRMGEQLGRLPEKPLANASGPARKALRETGPKSLG